jgi:hypothetical protein
MFQRHIEVRDLLNVSQFGCCVCHSTILQCMELTEHATLIFNNNMYTGAVFLDIEKGFDAAWYSGLLCRLYKLTFSTK